MPIINKMAININKLHKDFFDLFYEVNLCEMNVDNFCNLLKISPSFYHKKLSSKENIIVDSLKEYFNSLKIIQNNPKQILSDYNYNLYKKITSHNLNDIFFKNFNCYLPIFKDFYLSFFRNLLKGALIFDYAGNQLSLEFFILSNFDLLKNAIYLRSDEYLIY